MTKLERTDSRPTVIDLFCGAGGMSLGFEMAGYDIALGIEQDELAWKTHQLNFGDHCHRGDIREIQDPAEYIRSRGIAHVDVVVGGPPCQGFSRVGRGKIRKVRNEPDFVHDPRNKYYMEVIRFIQALKPKGFVIENVPDMQYYDDGQGLVLDKLLAELRKLGYENAERRILQAEQFGVPQTRRRLIIIGSLTGRGAHWPEQITATEPITVWEAISDLPIVPHGHRLDEMPYVARSELSDYQALMRVDANKVLFNHQTRWHREQDLLAFEWLTEGGKYIDLPEEYRRYRVDIFKDKYRKLVRDKPSWTVEAHIGKDSYRHIYPSRKGEPEPPRTISVREAARLQSFPDRFRFVGPFTRQFYQIGNAVPPLLAKAIAEAILPDILNS
jgi:DNA (cytosine-5)-methyltransferase 1